MTTRIKLRRDTATNWTATNPVLALGEPGYDTTNNKIKVGNGTSTWTQLSYLTDETGGGGIGDTAAAIELTGTIPYTNDNVLSTVVNFERPNNSPNTVDAIDTGLTIKRGNNQGIYNSANNVETQWNSNQSPLGTEWNADGWGDLTDVQTRTYTTFYEACDQNVGEVVTHKEFVMHDTINDKYYKIKFHFWQPNNGGGANQSLDGRSGFSYTRTLLDLSNGVYFVRGADDTNLGDEIGPGLTIKRDQAGGIYNSDEDAEWDPDNTPTGTLWNDDGWDDFTDITTRTWKPLYSAVHGQLGNHLVGAELLMHDTINNRYYTVKFTDWGVNNGGSFAYLRREINPTGTRLGITFADGSVQKTATTLGDLRVVNGNVFENAVQPGHGAEIRSDVKNNYYYNTNSWTGTANWVTSGNDGQIQFTNDDANNYNQVDFRNFLNTLGRWHSKTVSINGGDPQTITNWGNNFINTEDPPATDPTVVTEIRFYVTFRSRFYMGGENTVGFFLNDRDESFEVQSRDINLYGDDDVRIRGKDLVEIRNNGTNTENSYVQIVTDGSEDSKTWRFMPDGSLQVPYMDNTGWNYNYNLNGPTLKLGNNQEQTIITGADPTQNNPSARRLIIQGQRGYGTWGQNIAGEGGDVYIWGGVGGERDNADGGSGGDIKIRGGQGQSNAGGYVRIEGGDAAYWDGQSSGNGGFVEISGGNVTESGGNENNRGGDVTITAGKAKSDATKSGNIVLRTGGSDINNTTHNWTFENNGTLHLPAGGDILNSSGVSVLGDGNITLPQGSTINEVAAPLSGQAIVLTPSGGNETTQALKIYPTGAMDGDHIHLTANGGTTELYLGSDFQYVKLVNTGAVDIQSNNLAGNSAVWSFGTDGNLTVPGVIRSMTDASIVTGSLPIEAVAIQAVDYEAPFWRVFVNSISYPTLGLDAPVGSTFTPSWVYPVTATIQQILDETESNDQWVFYVDQNVLSGFGYQAPATFTPVVRTWTFGTDGNLTLPANGAISSTNIPATGNIAVAGEPSYSYNGTTMAVFDQVDFSQGFLANVQPGWTVSNGAGFSDTILSTNDPIPGAITTTSVYWPTGGGQTYTFTDPGYTPETVSPVTITVGSSNWVLDGTGNITLPQTNLDASPAPTSWPGITFSDGTFQNTAFSYPTGQQTVMLNATTANVGVELTSITGAVILITPEVGYAVPSETHNVSLPFDTRPIVGPEGPYPNIAPGTKLTVINYYNGTVNVSGWGGPGYTMAVNQVIELIYINDPGYGGGIWWVTNDFSW